MDMNYDILSYDELPADEPCPQATAWRRRVARPWASSSGMK